MQGSCAEGVGFPSSHGHRWSRAAVPLLAGPGPRPDSESGRLRRPQGRAGPVPTVTQLVENAARRGPIAGPGPDSGTPGVR